MDNEFYITLASNLYTTEFPNNNISYFQTPLYSPLQLDTNEWYVGLAEIILPDTWYNIKTKDKKITFRHKGRTPQTLYLEEGYYSPKQFVKELQAKIDTATRQKPNATTKPCNVTYDIESGIITINICSGSQLLLSKQLSTKLGFKQKVTFTEGENVADTICDLDNNCHIIFIYSNIVSETMLGNEFVKLLRTIATPSTLNHYLTQPIQYTTLTFDKPHYKKVSTSFENKIDIALVDSNGEPFVFKKGEAHVTLHFKRMKK